VSETEASTTLLTSQTSTATSSETEIVGEVSESTAETSSVGTISFSATSSSQIPTQASAESTATTGNTHLRQTDAISIFAKLFKMTDRSHLQ